MALQLLYLFVQSAVAIHSTAYFTWPLKPLSFYLHKGDKMNDVLLTKEQQTNELALKLAKRFVTIGLETSKHGLSLLEILVENSNNLHDKACENELHNSKLQIQSATEHNIDRVRRIITMTLPDVKRIALRYASGVMITSSSVEQFMGEEAIEIICFCVHLNQYANTPNDQPIPAMATSESMEIEENFLPLILPLSLAFAHNVKNFKLPEA